MKLEFFRQIFEKAQIPSFIKIHSVEAKLFHVDGQMDMTKLILVFCNFANMPKNDWITHTVFPFLHHTICWHVADHSYNYNNWMS
jgi:hypothetical protein